MLTLLITAAGILLPLTILLALGRGGSVRDTVEREATASSRV